MYTYRTYFKLTAPVIDYEEARGYLSEDTMVNYLKNEPFVLNGPLNGQLISIDWILRDTESGYIELQTNRELTNDELDHISSWIRGQHSDGLGEGFTQQSFACYPAEDYEDEYLDEDDYDYTIADFDWQTNDYKFDLISSN